MCVAHTKWSCLLGKHQQRAIRLILQHNKNEHVTIFNLLYLFSVFFDLFGRDSVVHLRFINHVWIRRDEWAPVHDARLPFVFTYSLPSPLFRDLLYIQPNARDFSFGIQRVLRRPHLIQRTIHIESKSIWPTIRLLWSAFLSCYFSHVSILSLKFGEFFHDGITMARAAAVGAPIISHAQHTLVKLIEFVCMNLILSVAANERQRTHTHTHTPRTNIPSSFDWIV